MLFYKLLMFLILENKIGGLIAQELFVCVPAALCGTGSSGGGSIDPRIVTPSGGMGGGCPAGTVPCYGQGSSSRCGIRSINPTTTADGPTQFGVYPWQAYLTVGNQYIGSGVLIDNYHVLTAAHKVANYSTNVINVIMGVFTPNDLSQTQTRVVSRVFIHESYSPSAANLKNDIAVLRVATPFGVGVQPNINTLCMPLATRTFPAGTSCVVAGWGQIQFNNIAAPTPMKQVTVPIVDYNTCYNSFNQIGLASYLDGPNEICAGGQAMKDACTQDGGAPLTCYDAASQRFYMAGLVIWGKGCGSPNVYGVYVAIAPYRAWINSKLAP